MGVEGESRCWSLNGMGNLNHEECNEVLDGLDVDVGSWPGRLRCSARLGPRTATICSVHC